MPGVPNEVVFAHPAGGNLITWGEVRGNQNAAYRVQCLAHRLRSFMVAQFQELRAKHITGPFIVGMTVMSGIEVLGEIFYSTPVPPDPKDASKEAFCRFCKKVDQRFGRAPGKNFKDAFEARWGEGRPDSVAAIFYKYFRNTLIHGYYGRSVFLTGDDTDDLLSHDDGYVLVNPDWLLEKFVEAAKQHVVDLLAAPPQSGLRRNALNYLHRLLDEPPEAP